MYASILLFGCLGLSALQSHALPLESAKREVANDFSREEIELVELTNKVRKKHHLPPLTMNIRLTTVAREQSADMAAHQKLSHKVKGKKLKARIKKSGYKYRRIGENIAHTKGSFSHVIQMWMNSPGHRKNMLNPKFKEMGVGIVKAKNGDGYFTQVFGRPKKKR